MGNKSSKVASNAAGIAKRQYPSTVSSAVKSSKPNPITAPPSQAAFADTAETTLPTQSHPSPAAAPPQDTKSSFIELDGRDPQFASQLSRAGTARRIPQLSQTSTSSTTSQPRPTQAFPTSSRPPEPQQAPTGQHVFPPTYSATPNASGAPANPAIAIVQARERLTRRYEAETEALGRKGFEGRTLLSARDLKDALAMRQAGNSEEEVERSMRLRKGFLTGLPSEVIGPVSSEVR
jgi:hypothetical protein